MDDKPLRARLGVCLLMAVTVGAAAVVLPVPAVASEPAMRVDTILAPTGLSAALGLPGSQVKPSTTFSQVDVATFDMVGVSWEGAKAGKARVRVRKGSQWGPWTNLEVEDEDAPDPGSDKNAVHRTVTRPLWVGKADGYEVESPRTDLQVHLVRQDGTRVKLRAERGPNALNRPPIQGRAAWGARAPRSAPGYAPAVKMAFVHHTVGSNNYGPNDVARILRSDQAYHMRARGWDDIGYNFLVDRFGRMWEGRAGGIERAVIGAHAHGFNAGTTGVAVMGNFSSSEVPPAVVNALAHLLGWKLGISGVDPGARTSMVSAGNDKYRAGAVAGFNNIAGHRDGKSTDCPGGRLYARLSEIRNNAGLHALVAGVSKLVGLQGVP